MADSLAVIDAQMRGQYPIATAKDNVGGINVPMTQARYDQWIADQAVSIRTQQLADEATAAWHATIQQFTAGKATLQADLNVVNARIDTNSPLTVPELRVGFRDLLQAMLWLANRIEDGTIVIRQPS